MLNKKLTKIIQILWNFAIVVKQHTTPADDNLYSKDTILTETKFAEEFTLQKEPENPNEIIVFLNEKGYNKSYGGAKFHAVQKVMFLSERINDPLLLVHMLYQHYVKHKNYGVLEEEIINYAKKDQPGMLLKDSYAKNLDDERYPKGPLAPLPLHC
jgi:hypothetical protein